MPELPRAHTANGFAVLLYCDALVLAIYGWSMVSMLARYPLNAGLAFVLQWQQVLAFVPPLILAISATGLILRWKPGWWLGLGMSLLQLLQAGAGAAMMVRVLRMAPPSAVEDGSMARGTVGLVLLFLAGFGWHLILTLGLLREDVRERMGLGEVQAWSAATRCGVFGTAVLCAVYLARLGLGL